MKKITLLLLPLFLLILVGCGSSTSTDDNQKNNTKKDESTEEKKETADMPTIKGSQAYDVVLSLEDLGIPKAETQIYDYGYVYESTGEDGDYSIIANKQHEIGYANFILLVNGDPMYLAYCATLPNDDYNEEEARAWVEANLKNEANTQFGNTLFQISQGNSGPILTIKAKGFDEYYASISKESN